MEQDRSKKWSYMETQVLEGKNCIVTGANRGIGRVIVESFVAEGANVWACSRTASSAFEEDMRNLQEQYGVWIEPVYFDLNSEEEMKQALSHIRKEKKSIDVLVNNAGMPYGALLQMTPMKDLKEVFQVNYFSQIYLMQLVSKIMIRQKSGSIINMASVGGIETNPGYLAYGSSKAALIWATQSIAKELGRYHIRVNAVAPGLTETEMGHYKSEEELQKVIDRTGMQRMARPEEIADAVVYLASGHSSFVNGQVLRVDGGR